MVGRLPALVWPGLRNPSPRSAWSMIPKGRLDSAASPRPMLTLKRPPEPARACSTIVVLPRPASPTMNRLRPRPLKASDSRPSMACSAPSRSQICDWGIPSLPGNPKPSVTLLRRALTVSSLAGSKITASLQRRQVVGRIVMRRLIMSLVLMAGLLTPQSALAGQPSVGVVTNFGPNLAAVCPMPEGIAVDPTGNLYASSFAFKPIANICVENRSGQIIDVIPVAAGKAGVASLLGELFEPSQGLYVLDFADGAPTNGRLLRVNVQTHAVTVVATGFQAPNAIAQDRHRNLYISDSFLGAIFRVSP